MQELAQAAAAGSAAIPSAAASSAATVAEVAGAASLPPAVGSAGERAAASKRSAFPLPAALRTVASPANIAEAPSQTAPAAGTSPHSRQPLCRRSAVAGPAPRRE